jgi:hypothetical protein
MEKPLTELLGELLKANREVAKALSRIAWDEDGNIVYLEQELPGLVMDAQWELMQGLGSGQDERFPD